MIGIEITGSLTEIEGLIKALRMSPCAGSVISPAIVPNPIGTDQIVKFSETSVHSNAVKEEEEDAND